MAVLQKLNLLKSGSCVTYEGRYGKRAAIIKEAKTGYAIRQLEIESRFFKKHSHLAFIPSLLFKKKGLQVTEKVDGVSLSSTEASKRLAPTDARRISGLLKAFKAIDHDCRNRYFPELVRLLLKTYKGVGIRNLIRIVAVNLALFPRIWRNLELTHGDFTERNIVFGRQLFLLDFSEVKRSVKYFDACFMFLHKHRNLEEASWHIDFLADYLADDRHFDKELLRVAFIHAALWHLSNHPRSTTRKKQLAFFVDRYSPGITNFFEAIAGRLYERSVALL